MEPFIKRSRYSLEAFINKETLIYLLARLKQLGFDQQKIILPILSISDDKKIGFGPEEKVLSTQKYLELEQDFDGLILEAQKRTNEEIVILFKNDSINRLSFDNKVFRMVEKKPTDNLYISTSSPAETYGINSFLKDFFKNQVRNPGLNTFLLVTTIVVGATIVFFFVRVPKNVPTIIVLVLVMIVWTVLLIRFLPMRGLRISTRKKWGSYPFVTELKKNSLVILVTSILSLIFGLLGTYIAKLLGWT